MAGELMPSMQGMETEQAGPRTWTEADIGCDDARRFVIELEFLQSLANPHYLNWLAQNRYFEDPAFISYLSYLLYWREPRYSRFLRYPQSLYFLELLQREQFRTALANVKVAEEIHTQQFYYWQHYRTKQGSTSAGPAGGGPDTDPSSGAAGAAPAHAENAGGHAPGGTAAELKPPLAAVIKPEG